MLNDTDAFLRRQIERIEQGMGRGVRSHDDYCVVLLAGPELTRRISSPKGHALLTPPTRAQMELAKKLSTQMADASIAAIRETIDSALARDPQWVAAIKSSTSSIAPDNTLRLNSTSMGLRKAFDLRRDGNLNAAAEILTELDNNETDDGLKSWIKVRRAEAIHGFNPDDAQALLSRARLLNRQVLKPLNPVASPRLAIATRSQIDALIDFHNTRFLTATDCMLEAQSLCSDLVFDPQRTQEFEAAFDKIGHMIGAKAYRPEKERGEGPDNLFIWLAPQAAFVIEAKSGATSQNGISKSDLGQMGQSLEWFSKQYPEQSDPIPVMIHHMIESGDGATMIPGLRIMTKANLETLKSRFLKFCEGVADPGVRLDANRVGALLKENDLTPKQFIQAFTSAAK